MVCGFDMPVSPPEEVLVAAPDDSAPPEVVPLDGDVIVPLPPGKEASVAALEEPARPEVSVPDVEVSAPGAGAPASLGLEGVPGISTSGSMFSFAEAARTLKGPFSTM